MKQIVFTVGSDFDIDANGQYAGQIIQKIFHWGKLFELRNANDELVAYAQQESFSLTSKVHIFDCTGAPIGGMQLDVLDSLLSIRTYYSIYDGNDQFMGRSNTLEWGDTEIHFNDPANRRIATLYRPLINFLADEWSIAIYDPQSIDLRVLFFAAAYKTSAAHYQHSSRK